MRPTSQPMRILALIEQAGPAGISMAQLVEQIGCPHGVFKQCCTRLRQAGHAIHTLFKSTKGGGQYFAQQDWRDAAAVEWRAQVEAAYQAKLAKARKGRARTVAPRPAPTRTRAEWLDLLQARKSATLAAKAEAREQAAQAKAAAKVQRANLKQLARDLKKRAAKEEAKPKAKLHGIGQHMPSVARDGRMVSKHQATFDRQRQATVKAPAGPVDFSRAIVTVCPSGRDTRFVAEGPVFSVLNPNECRPWAKAATA